MQKLLHVNLDLTTVSDHDLTGSTTTVASEGFNLLDNIHTILDGTKNDVLSIKPGSLGGSDEELGSVGVGSSIGHGQETRTIVLQLEVLISKLGSIDGLATSSVSSGKVTTLAHELGDDTVEAASFVAEAGFTSAEGTEVLSGLGDNIGEELKGDAAKGFTIGGHIEEDNRVGHDGCRIGKGSPNRLHYPGEILYPRIARAS